MRDDVDINTLTMEQYLVLIQDNIRQGIVKPEIDGDIKFEINGNFMREVRREIFKDMMMKMPANMCEGPALRWKNRLSSKLITACDFLEKVFIRQYCSIFKTAMKLDKIRNFKQEMDETLYHAWERYNDILFRCLQHDLNHHQKSLKIDGYTILNEVNTAYRGVLLGVRATRERINDSPNSVDTQKLKENIHAIQASFKNCEGAHLTKECPLKKEEKAVEQSKKVAEMLHAAVLEHSHDVQILHAAVTEKDRDLMVDRFNGRFMQVLITTDDVLPPEFDQSLVNVVINWVMPRLCDSFEEEEPDVAVYS
uniref:Uncharacterized protein n=1 Tax=Tanacetum cinerariifolium TaxID=118510 RepID=A0A6L2LAE1_TANCI|nr:hypothetical protein [Tanacetum cinerariifolium]